MRRDSERNKNADCVLYFRKRTWLLTSTVRAMIPTVMDRTKSIAGGLAEQETGKKCGKRQRITSL